MFSGAKQSESKLQDALDKALEELSGWDAKTDEYAKVMEQIVKLHKMKLEAKHSSVSPDTLALIVANLLGIVIILKHERADIITSKAMSLAIKPR